MKLPTGLLLSAWVICVSPAIALAEQVAVRSGEHPGFTRVVIQLGGREDWDFGRVDGGFEFRPARGDISYRLARVFDKIGRTRIGDVRDIGEGRLRLDVVCDCHARVESLTNGLVVLDIADGPAQSPGTGVDAPLPAIAADTEPPEGAGPAEPMLPAGLELLPHAPAAVSDRAGLPLTFPGAARAEPAGGMVPVSPAGGASVQPAHEDPSGPVVAVTDPHPERETRIARTESELLEQVARAAAQGLLEADVGELEKDVAATALQPPDRPVPAPVEPEPPVPPVVQRGHITVETSIDRASARSAHQSMETEEGARCLDPALFDVASWGGDVAQGTDIAAYRSRIVSALDVADGAGVTELARNYIYITFGAEAKALMRRYRDEVERPDILFAMAEIMDTGSAQTADALVDQMSCDGATALWATLAQPELRPGQAINTDSVSLSFSALPPHLRRHLGPGLADRFLALGDLSTADMVRNAIERAGQDPTPEQEMLAARFEIEAGAVDTATEILDGVVATGDAVLPEALLQRVETTLVRGHAVPDDIIVLLDSMAFQFRGTETARHMVDAGIRARASASAYSDAFSQLAAAETAGLLNADRAMQLRAEVFDRLTRDADDPGFLRLAMGRVSSVPGLPVTTRRALAARFLDLGFAEAAREALGNGTAMPEPPDRQLLARAAMLEGKPAVAIGYLAGLTDTTAQELRARALDLARDHAGAMRVYEAAGDQRKALEMAWRGGVWREVEALDDGPLGVAAALMSGTPASTLQAPGDDTGKGSTAAGTPGAAAAYGQGTDEGDTPLARAGTLIAESEATRAALAALLTEFVSSADVSAPAERAGF